MMKDFVVASCSLMILFVHGLGTESRSEYEICDDESSYAYSYQPLTCPNNSRTSQCSSCSGVGDAICFASRNYNGLNYGFVNFNEDKIVFTCSVYYDCQPCFAYELRIINVLGILISLKGRKSTKLYYYNFIQNGPRVTEIPASGMLKFVRGGLDERLPCTALPHPLAYLVFQKITSNDYNAECNDLTPKTQDCQCSCPSPYFLRQPAATVSFARCTSVVTGFLNNSNDNATGLGLFANAYGLPCLKCRRNAQPQPSSDPPVFVEVCSTLNNGYNCQQSCNYRGSPYCPKTTGCYDQNNPEIFEYYAQSYKKAYSNYKKKTIYTRVICIPQIYGEPNYIFMPIMARDAISYFEVAGYGSNRFLNDILNSY